MLKVAVILVAVAVCSDLALGAKYCCYPPIWESLNFIRTGGIDKGVLVSSSGEEQVSVDTNVSMVNSMASTTSSGVTTSVRTIQDWANRKQYIIKGGKCTTSTLPGPFSNQCVPDDAKEVAPDIDFGLMSHLAHVQVFEITRGNVTSFLDIVKPDCIPMTTSSFGSMNGGEGLSMKMYTNFTLGIKDRSVFNIPSICTQATHQIYRRSLFGL